jgi:hypothetical protein
VTLYTDTDAAILAQGIVRPAFLFRMVTTPGDVVRIWGGVGPLAIAADGVETTDQAEYYGAGELTDIPVLEQLINGVAQRIEFVLSGAAVESRVLQIADDEAQTVRGARVNIGVKFFADDWSTALPVRWLWEGEADTLDPESTASAEGRARALRLSVGSIFTGRRRGTSAFYTDLSQQAKSTGDLFCNRVNLYKQEIAKPWPRA